MRPKAPTPTSTRCSEQLRESVIQEGNDRSAVARREEVSWCVRSFYDEGQGRSVRGSEGARRAIAVIVDVPGAPALGFIGSWAADAPRHEAAILDMVRAIERCQIEVGRGCVTADERKRAAL